MKQNISYVTLQRQECGFGFRIVGGKEEGSQVNFQKFKLDVVRTYVYIYLDIW